MTKRIVVGFLIGLAYIDLCFGITTMISFPPRPLPAIFYPVQPMIMTPFRFEKDCYRYEKCWWSEDV
jgi:hypothetical protein